MLTDSGLYPCTNSIAWEAHALTDSGPLSTTRIAWEAHALTESGPLSINRLPTSAQASQVVPH